jgi:hypothetical protein
MITSANIYYYIAVLAIVVSASYIGNHFKQAFNNNDEESELIRKYLLNDSPLYGFNKPKLWIHTKYEVNARKWKSFYSRNSTDLNQPYIHLTIKTIINHCGDDFNICLIDDDSFSKLIPKWDINIMSAAEPKKSQIRELGMAQLLYIYGGVVVPNSFVCSRNLIELYEVASSTNAPFVSENVNRYVNLSAKTKPKLLFLPEPVFMGAPKKNEVIKDYIDFLRSKNSKFHFSAESDIKGETSYWLLEQIKHNKITLIGGEKIGVKTAKSRKPILLEDLMEDDYLDVDKDAFGIYIPEDEILQRTKYQWFAVMSGEEILKSNMIISKYLIASIVDSKSEYTKPQNTTKSIISI